MSKHAAEPTTLPQTYLGEITGGAGTVSAFGCVTFRDRVVYLDLAGAKTSVEAVWAQLSQGNTLRLVDIEQTKGIPLASNRKGAFARYQKQIIPGLEHCVLIDRFISEPPYAEIGETFIFHRDDKQAIEKLAEHLRSLICLPLFPAWHEYLWDYGRRNGLILPCLSVKNTLSLYRVDLNKKEWESVITSSLKKGWINLPTK